LNALGGVLITGFSSAATPSSNPTNRGDNPTSLGGEDTRGRRNAHNRLLHNNAPLVPSTRVKTTIMGTGSSRSGSSGRSHCFVSSGSHVIYIIWFVVVVVVDNNIRR
jgi:hypothetical protein